LLQFEGEDSSYREDAAIPSQDLAQSSPAQEEEEAEVIACLVRDIVDDSATCPDAREEDLVDGSLLDESAFESELLEQVTVEHILVDNLRVTLDETANLDGMPADHANDAVSSAPNLSGSSAISVVKQPARIVFNVPLMVQSVARLSDQDFCLLCVSFRSVSANLKAHLVASECY
jgi:hypothetical protein